ncbi:MAG: AI-2E family transporter [Armatimonadota bacterium]
MNPKAWVEAVLEMIWRVGLRLALWGAGLYVLYRVRSVIVLIILAAVLAYAVSPIVDLLCTRRVRCVNRKLQRLGATLVVFALLGVLAITVIAEFAKPFNSELVELGKNSGTYIGQLRDLATTAQRWYLALPDDARNFLSQQDFNGVVSRLTEWGTKVGNSTILAFTHLFEVILIPVLAFYFVLDTRSLKREFLAIVPKPRAREALAITHELNNIMRSYVIGQIILCIIAGVAVAAVMQLTGMKYVLILSVLAGVTRAVPIIGPIASGIVIVLLGTAQSPMLGFDLLIFFTLLHFAESKFIMPKLIGHRMQLHPAIILIVLLIGAEFFGIFGMFMAAPVAALVRVLVRYYLIKPRELHVWGLAHPTPQPAVETAVSGEEYQETV